MRSGILNFQSVSIPQALQLAIQRHQAGRWAEAEALYRQILAAQPHHAEALHLLGVIAHQSGRHDAAVEWIRKAIAVNPREANYHLNLGNALSAQDRLDEAIASYHRALHLKPDFPEAHNNLGNALRLQGQLEEAIAAFRRALELKPGHPETHNNLGNALRDRGRFDEAIAAFRHALALKPGFPEASNDLGNALRDQGRFDEAIAAFRHALELKADDPDAHANLGNALRERGRFDEAVAACHRALQLRPDFPVACNNLGNALRERGQIEESIAAYRRALELKPEHAWVHSNLIFALHLHPGHDLRTLSEEHRRWNRQFSDPLKPLLRPHTNARNPERRLRVGYVSPDFRDHPAGRFALPLLERHDRERFEILCYAGVARPDGMTKRFRAVAAQWRNTMGVPDAGLAEMIRKDGVDILVDLALHTADNRLPMFARQPAPVQVTWLAYPGSTGLDAIGYRLTDARMDPPGEKSSFTAEEPVRLPDCWCCYEPAADPPEIHELPALSGQGVTFGSLNNFAKVNERVLALWARVLAAVRASRLVMLCPEGQTRERVRAFFGARGIGAERVEMVGFVRHRDYLSLYQRIDIALDPFPCNGMTTTCDALWMGAPVLTLPGGMPISRAGLSLLSSVGLGELAASSEEDYVRMAVELAGNLPCLAGLRATLRARMLASPLMDAPRFARNVETAYRSMWERWRLGSG